MAGFHRVGLEQANGQDKVFSHLFSCHVAIQTARQWQEAVGFKAQCARRAAVALNGVWWGAWERARVPPLERRQRVHAR